MCVCHEAFGADLAKWRAGGRVGNEGGTAKGREADPETSFGSCSWPEGGVVLTLGPEAQLLRQQS